MPSPDAPQSSFASGFLRSGPQKSRRKRVLDRSADELALIRKAIELGTDVILTQTVVQADGDVVVRIDPTIASGEMRAAADAADAAVNQTLAYWRSLVDLIGVVATTAATPVGVRVHLGELRRLGLHEWRARRSAASATPADERVGARQTWTLLRTTGAELFSRGGAAVESPAGSEEPYARTVIQPDGDALWFVRHDALADRGLLDQHMTRVGDWYTSTGSAIAGARGYIVRLRARRVRVARARRHGHHGHSVRLVEPRRRIGRGRRRPATRALRSGTLLPSTLWHRRMVRAGGRQKSAWRCQSPATSMNTTRSAPIAIERDRDAPRHRPTDADR